MRDLLLESFRVAVAAADPLQIVPAHVPRPPSGRTFVAAAGKAAASMALVVEQAWPADAPLEGIALTRYGHGLPLRRVQLVEAGHPLPDESGLRAAAAILESIRGLRPDDLLLVLLSGGGSALLGVPAPGLSLGDMKAVTGALLRCGAPIQDVNTVRKHLSATLGGRLAAATRARVLALIVSDVAGDDPTHIASGPCAPDPTTFAEAVEVLERYAVAAPPAVRAHLESGIRGGVGETPKPGDAAFLRVENRVIASARPSLEAGAEVFRARGIAPALVGDALTGEAASVGRDLAGLALRVRGGASPHRPPVALLSGGECTVAVRASSGRGGRCKELLLSMATRLDGAPGVYALAADTDGLDGTEDDAGAFVLPDTLARARALGLDARAMLERNDSYAFFSALGDLVVTGPTRTNVNEYRAVVLT